MAPHSLTTLEVLADWTEILSEKNIKTLERTFPDYLKGCRWFGGKAKKIQRTVIKNSILMPAGSSSAFMVFLEVWYDEGSHETYVLPITFASGQNANEIAQKYSGAVIARVQLNQSHSDGVIYDGLENNGFCSALLEAVGKELRFKNPNGEITGKRTPLYGELAGQSGTDLHPSLIRAEQSNSSISYGNRLILKMYRRLEPDINPDLEMGRFLTEKTEFSHTPSVAGFLEYRNISGRAMTLGILQEFVTSQGDAWEYSLAELMRYFDRILAKPAKNFPQFHLSKPLLTFALEEIPSLACELIGPYLDSARLLGQRTAELHLALSKDTKDPAFIPEPFDKSYQASVVQSMQEMAGKVFDLLEKRIHDLPEYLKPEAKSVLALKNKLLNCFRSFSDHELRSMRIRCHGDYHLGQLLYTGSDFVIMDFEGEPVRTLAERRMKHSPLRDVAGMLRSFHYAAFKALFNKSSDGSISKGQLHSFEGWSRFWHLWVSTAFLQSYLKTAANAPFLPQDRKETEVLLNAFLLEKAAYEMGYELNNRPDWVKIPFQGILQIIHSMEDS